MKLYLDNCTLNRLFDDPTQTRIVEEARAVAVIVQRIADGHDRMVDSVALHEENRICPDLWRREEVNRLRRIASEFQALDESAMQRAEQLVQQGCSPLDALHLALAEAAAVDYFVTTDDRLLRKAIGVGVRVSVANPITYVAKEVSR